MADPRTAAEATLRYGPLLEAFEAAGGYESEHAIERVLTGLGFSRPELERPIDQLSGGQTTRALLARLLLQRPGLLLLDEPTNHLDIQAIEWLEGVLRDWPGALVAVAHDRAFLDRVADRVWELASGRLHTYRGNTSAYALQRAARLERQRQEARRQQRHIAATEDYIRRNIAGQRTRQAQGRRKRLERLERLDEPATAPTLRLALDRPRRGGDLVVACQDLRVGHDPDCPLLACDALELRWPERAVLLGPNGAGKTSFLRTLLGELPPLAGQARLGAGVRVGTVDQRQARLDADRSVLEHVLAASPKSTAEARRFLGGYLFSGDDVFKPVADLSGGERARLALALLALDGANLLVLDEPTSHLDIASQEMLQAVLVGFPGSVILATHDRYLAAALGGQVWAIADGGLQVCVEGDADYRRRLAAAGAPAPPDGPEGADGRSRHDRQKRAAREAERQARADRERLGRQAELEAAIAALEARLGELTAELEAASAAQDVPRLRRLGDEYARVEAELQQTYGRWSRIAD
jgi:ATP-binding cassette subfamily F protein 3